MPKAPSWNLRSSTVPVIIAGALLVALVFKFFWTLAVFDLPLGYDTGIYRYLFLRHAQGFPPFVLGTMDGWAQEQPLGLFMLTSPLVRLGVPVDALIGWIWNLIPVLLASVLAWKWTRREGQAIGILILLLCLLSLAQFYGFMGMYWKTYASLCFTVLAFDAFERRSLWMLPWIVLAISVHHQTGLVLMLSLLSALATIVLRKRRRIDRQDKIVMTVLVAAFCLGIAFYLPQWNQTVLPLIARLLQSVGGTATPGSFPGLSFFAVASGVLWTLGLLGFIVSFRKEQGTVWQWAVAWTLLPVVLRTLFHHRFLIHLDFFLLPFAAIGTYFLWNLFYSAFSRAVLAMLLCAQGALLVLLLLPNTYGCGMLNGLCPKIQAPRVIASADSVIIDELQSANRTINDAYVIVLEPQTAPWVRGWLTDATVGGPGVLASPWDKTGWEKFLLGSSNDRQELLKAIPQDVFLYASPLFRTHYAQFADALLSDPCVQPTAFPSFFQYSCVPTASGVQ